MVVPPTDANVIACSQQRRSSIRCLAPLILILLLAGALRFNALARQSFWNDEGNTARLVERPVALIIEGAAGDIHPPGYYVGLHLWRAFTGESEFALRAYSALCGVLTVAVVAAVSRIATDRRGTGWASHNRRRIGPYGAAGYGAAALAAIHPLGVSYGQEARMYAQLGLATALTLWAAVALVARAERCTIFDESSSQAHRRRLSGVLPVGLAGAIALGLYTHYAYALALAGLNVAFGLYWLSRRLLSSEGRQVVPAVHRCLWRLLLAWFLAHALGGLSFLPWAPIALRAGGWRPPDLMPGGAAAAMVRTLLAGTTLPQPISVLPVVSAAVLILMALWMLLRRGRAVAARFAIWAALGMALFPPGLIAGAGIYRPAYLKFLMVSVAPLAVALAAPLGGWLGAPKPTETRGTAHRLSRVLALILWLSLVPTLGKSLYYLYTDPVTQRDDYRGIAALIREEGRDGDAILLSAPNQWEVFTYYYREAAGDTLPVYPAPYRPMRAEAERWVDDIIAARQGGRLFVLFWGDLESDPERHIERALTQRAFKAGDAWITSVRLARYGTGPLPTAPTVEIDAVLGGGVPERRLRLIGYHVPTRLWQQGDILPLTLFWRAEAPPEEPLKVFVHLVDVQGALVAQTDMEPQAGFRPTWTWSPGEPLTDRYGVLLPMGLSQGTYTLRVGMYRYSGDRLPIVVDGAPAGDYLSLDQVRVGSP